ncbi:MAG: hypothetical protein Q4D81_01450 [Eubacteriales bacterium]|nr:hypothetical protein [Eubacteriales bacterium]
MDVNGLNHYSTPRLTLLRTDESEPEWLFKNTFCDPDAGIRQCREPCVFYRLRYENPQQQFTGIRKLILSIRRSMGMRSGFYGTAGIDVSAWKDHEEEEYFQILLKYLYDNSREWSLVFICSNYSDREYLCLKYHCVNYFAIESRALYLYPQGILEANIRNAFSDIYCEIEPDAAAMLAEALRSCSSCITNLFQKLPRIACEVLRRADSGEKIPIYKYKPDTSGNRGSGNREHENLEYGKYGNPVISAGMMSSYLNDPSGLVGMIMEKAGCRASSIA